MYYLQSRYYNPEWGRFINADGIAEVKGELLSHNVFAYCVNNPILMIDPSGFRPLRFDGEEVDYTGITNDYGAAKPYKQVSTEKINCYAYALGLSKKNNPGYIANPASNTPGVGVQQWAEGVERDMKKLKRGIRRINGPHSYIFSEERRIAIRGADGGGDYHFMVQNSDGSWSHKPGQLDSESLKDRGECPNTIQWDSTYNSSIIYFAITDKKVKK